MVEHHLTPKSQGGRETVLICQECHSAIHGLYTNKELQEKFDTVSALKCSLPFRKAAAFISKQDPGKRIKTKRSKNRGRNDT